MILSDHASNENAHDGFVEVRGSIFPHLHHLNLLFYINIWSLFLEQRDVDVHEMNVIKDRAN